MPWKSQISSRQRFRFELPHAVAYRLDGDWVEGVLCDVSTGGARITSVGELPDAGAKTCLRFQLHHDAPKILVDLEVLRSGDGEFAGSFVEPPAQLVFQLSGKVAEAVRNRIRPD